MHRLYVLFWARLLGRHTLILGYLVSLCHDLYLFNSRDESCSPITDDGLVTYNHPPLHCGEVVTTDRPFSGCPPSNTDLRDTSRMTDGLIRWHSLRHFVMVPIRRLFSIIDTFVPNLARLLDWNLEHGRTVISVNTLCRCVVYNPAWHRANTTLVIIKECRVKWSLWY